MKFAVLCVMWLMINLIKFKFGLTQALCVMWLVNIIKFGLTQVQCACHMWLVNIIKFGLTQALCVMCLVINIVKFELHGSALSHVAGDKLVIDVYIYSCAYDFGLLTLASSVDLLTHSHNYDTFIMEQDQDRGMDEWTNSDTETEKESEPAKKRPKLSSKPGQLAANGSMLQLLKSMLSL